MSDCSDYDMLPPQILKRSLGGCPPYIPVGRTAQRLWALAAGNDTRGDWQPVEELFDRRPAAIKKLRQQFLNGAMICNEPAYGGSPIAVGRTKRMDNLRPAWFVALDSEVLRHSGRVILFPTAKQAQRVAPLADLARHLRRTYNLVPAVFAAWAELQRCDDTADLTKPPPRMSARALALRQAVFDTNSPLHDLSIAIAALDGALFRCRGDVVSVSVDWPPTMRPLTGIAFDFVNRVLAKLDEFMDHDYQAAVTESYADLDRLIAAA